MGVMTGQAVRIQNGEISLEGLLHLPEGEAPFPGVVVCHPHPRMGGDMYNRVVGTILKACLAEGIAALRFNFRGVGASEGTYDDGKGEETDIEAALTHLRLLPEIDGRRLALAGYSFGAMVALRVASGRDDLQAMVAVSNPTVRGPKVEIEMKVPTLFVTGDRDQYCDGELLKEYREQIGDDVTVEVVQGVDHFWAGSDDRLKEIVSAFLRKHVSG